MYVIEENEYRTFTRKGYGRIYTRTEEDIRKVQRIIKEIDKYEYEYMPKDLVTTFSDFPKVTFIGKFDDLDLNKLEALCFERGINIFIFDSKTNDRPQNYLKLASIPDTDTDL